MGYVGKVTCTIDIIDYVNGIGNCSREQYLCIEHGRALRVIVSVIALSSSVWTSIEVAASKRLRIQGSGIEEHY